VKHEPFNRAFVLIFIMVKAQIIISTEYKANLPHTFMKIGRYYVGDVVYPKIRNFPQDPRYWKSTTASDSDRFFGVWEREVNDEDLRTLIDLQLIHESLHRNGKHMQAHYKLEILRNLILAIKDNERTTND
jgi:hypothetical protein